ncbi:SlyX family protein [Methylonatrum kenyense]|uniref:SlyX family protein n=1 Tax=Methylonatrum kenyense TaxID=455253 RepID=UPI0020BE42C9|nr:SlyX family protein [Methylonatrum kenyense]MCK8515598.1 SlyX family protein [Methylonatrum kenyense]
MKTEERVTELEIRLTHLESGLDEITRVLLERDRAFEVLRREHTQLRKRLRDMERSSGGADAMAHEPPPHY